MPAAADALFTALSDPTRRSIFERLVREGEQTVRVLTHAGAVSQPAVSKHLRVLKLAGLVRDRPEGRQVHYRADPAGLATLAEWLRFYAAFWDEKFDRLEDLLKRMDQ